MLCFDISSLAVNLANIKPLDQKLSINIKKICCVNYGLHCKFSKYKAIGSKGIYTLKKNLAELIMDYAVYLVVRCLISLKKFIFGGRGGIYICMIRYSVTLLFIKIL